MNVLEEFSPLVTELLNEFGADATLTRSGRSAPTLAEARAGKLASTMPAVLPVRVVLQEQRLSDAAGRQDAQTTVTMIAEPHEGDMITLAGRIYTVGSVIRVAPQGQAIIYRAEVR